MDVHKGINKVHLKIATNKQSHSNEVPSRLSTLSEGKKQKVKVSAEFYSRHFHSATIAVTAFRALGVYQGKNRYAEDSNPGRWFRS